MCVVPLLLSAVVVAFASVGDVVVVVVVAAVVAACRRVTQLASPTVGRIDRGALAYAFAGVLAIVTNPPATRRNVKHGLFTDDVVDHYLSQLCLATENGVGESPCLIVPDTFGKIESVPPPWVPHCFVSARA